MKKLLVLLFSILLFFSQGVGAESVFYCQSELATGFIKENNSFKVTKFENLRWTIKFNDNYSELYGLDEERPYLCAPAYQHTPNLLACLSGYNNGQNFMFNKVDLRFLLNNATIRGYVDDGTDTSAIFAGTCKKF